MKHTKKLASLLLALVMLFAIAIPAFAEPSEGDETTPTGSITISNPDSGKTYSIYRLLDLTTTESSSEGGATTYSYSPVSAWNNFFNQKTIPGNFLEMADGYVISTIDNPTAENLNTFTTAALTFAEENTINATASKELGEGETEVKFTDLALGYYLVVAGDDTVCCLTTTAPDVTVHDKTEVPSIEKQVREGDQTLENPGEGSDKVPYWRDTNDVAIGERVDFKTTITARAGAENYVLIDTMEPGLEFTTEAFSIGVELAPREAGSGTGTGNRPTVAHEQILKDFTGLNTENKYYTLEADTDKHGFTVTFTDEFMNIINQFYQLKDQGKTNLADDFGTLLQFNTSEKDYNLAVPDEFKIVVQYRATLTDDAKIGDWEHVTASDLNSDYYNVNTTYLKYGDKTDPDQTDPVSTRTYTWQLTVNKYTMENGSEVSLEGVEFQLKYNTTLLYFTKVTPTGEETYYIDGDTPVYRFCSQNDTGATQTLVTGKSGKFLLIGLNGGGKYYLDETKPLAGYNAIPTKDFYVEDITNTTKPGQLNTTSGGDVYKILNNKGVILPSTGGIGTTIFYVAGILLILCAVVLFIIKKRPSAKKR